MNEGFKSMKEGYQSMNEGYKSMNEGYKSMNETIPINEYPSFIDLYKSMRQ